MMKIDEAQAERSLVVGLRSIGKSYSEIYEILGYKIPKSTISGWCKVIKMPQSYYDMNSVQSKEHLANIRQKSRVVRAQRKFYHLKNIREGYKYIRSLLVNDANAGKIALAMIYLGEGRKSGSSLLFGNSNPAFIKLYLLLLRKHFSIDETKFRCTVQCRSDQNVEELEKFWSEVTNIPHSQFYKARVDLRTIGIPTKKRDYKGVCRIDYFSIELFNQINEITNVCLGP